jgi:hypothetical protein
LHRSLLLTLLAASAIAGAAQAAPFTCPARHQGKAFEGVTVFDGPPEEMASLRGHESREVKGKFRSWWSVQESLKAGRELHVQCRYAGGAAQVIKPPKTAKTCVEQLRRLDNKGNYRTLSFSCQ